MYYDERKEVLPEVAPVEPKLERWQEYLLLIADYIRQHGWCQHTARDDAGRVCILGAFGEVFGESGVPYKIHLHAMSSLQQRVGYDIPRWNDGCFRTASQVLHLLETTARGERSPC